MKYTPRELKTNVNVSPRSPVKEFCLLVVGLLGMLVTAYAALGFCVDFIAPRLPYELEQSLGDLYAPLYSEAESDSRARRIESIFNELVETLPSKPLPYKIYLVENQIVNAIALPGGRVVVFSGLIDEVKTDSELSFVLAHELGHFFNRDHLRGLGRGLVLWGLAAFLLGTDNSATDFLAQVLTGVNMKFSRQQEAAADMFAIDLINRCYGRTDGAVEFMRKIAEKEKRGRLAYYFATHPYPANRISQIEKRIQELEYIQR